MIIDFILSLIDQLIKFLCDSFIGAFPTVSIPSALGNTITSIMGLDSILPIHEILQSITVVMTVNVFVWVWKYLEQIITWICELLP